MSDSSIASWAGWVVNQLPWFIREGVKLTLYKHTFCKIYVVLQITKINHGSNVANI